MRWLLALMLWIGMTGPCLAQDAVIRIWGTPAMLGVAERWAEAFARDHPEIRFEFAMKGSDSAIHGLVGGVADVALMGRENDVVDDNGFARPKQYPVTRIEVATGSVSMAGKSDAIAVLVDAANPVASLTLAQLASILDCGDQPSVIATWGQLGLKGEWAEAPIHIHSYEFASRTGRWLQDRMTGGDRRMCWDRITEYADDRRLDGTIAMTADLAGAAAQGDRFALVLANPMQAYGTLRLVPLTDAGETVLPSRETIQARTYPLTRRAYAYIDRPPGKQLPPHVLQFLRFVLSVQGQALLGGPADYLPLDRQTAASQLVILESIP